MLGAVRQSTLILEIRGIKDLDAGNPSEMTVTRQERKVVLHSGGRDP
jgi:hypothetical protein